MNNIFEGIQTWVRNHIVLIAIITLVLMAPAAIGLTYLKFDSSVSTLVSSDSQVGRDLDRFNADFSGIIVLILLESEQPSDLFEPQNVQAMASIEDTLNSSTPSVLSAVGPAFVIRQAVASQTGSPDLPNEQQTLMNMVVDTQTGEIREGFRNVFPDNTHAMIAVVLDGELNVDEMGKVIDKVEGIVKGQHFTHVEPILTGESVLVKEMSDTMGKTMATLMVIAVIIMLIILALIFKVRNSFAWRWMPLATVLIATLFCFGVTGFIGLKITVVTLSALPVLIGLGADYAIQFHNRYDEEVRRGRTFAGAVMASAVHIGPAIAMAIVVACLGFAALFFSPIPAVQNFGLTLIIGVVACYIVSLFFMLAVLYWNDQRKGDNRQPTMPEKRNSEKEGGIVERVLGWMAPRVLRNPAIILPIALVLCGAGVFVDGKIDSQTDFVEFSSPHLKVIKDLRKLEALTGGRSSINIFVQAKDVTDPQTLNWMKKAEEAVMREQSGLVYASNSLPGLVAQSNEGTIPSTSEEVKAILQNVPPVVKQNLVTDDFSSANLEIGVRSLTADQMKMLKASLESYVAENPPPDGGKATVTGTVVMLEKVIDGLTGGREEMTFMGMVLVFCGLLVLFRFRIWRALMAILPIGFIIGWSSLVMYAMGFEYTAVTATLGALIIGIGVEFTILLMMRFYEEREKGATPAEAMTIAMSRIGRAIIASGLTVIGGFGALLGAVDWPILQDFGVMTMINVLFALISTLIVLPPLIVWIESWLERRSTAKVNPNSWKKTGA